MRNYAEYTPTLSLPANRTAEEFYCVPDRQSVAGNTALLGIDAVSGGGDAFDIAQAVKEVQATPGVPQRDSFGKTIPAGITDFRFIRMTDALVGDKEGDLLEISAEIDAVADVRPAESIGRAKTRADGEFTMIKDAVVAGVFPVGDPKPQEIYIQEEDRSAVVRIVNTASLIVKVGDTVIVTGHLGTASGERTIVDPLVTVLSSGAALRPLGMNTAATLRNPGRLVRTWGEVTANDYDNSTFTIKDGSGELKVWSGLLVQPSVGEFVSVTGVVGPQSGETVVKARTQDDIVKLR
jgi:hypothetical protein